MIMHRGDATIVEAVVADTVLVSSPCWESSWIALIPHDHP